MASMGRLTRELRRVAAGLSETTPAELPDEWEHGGLRVRRMPHDTRPMDDDDDGYGKPIAGRDRCEICERTHVRTKSTYSWAKELLMGYGLGKDDFKYLDDTDHICSECARDILEEEFGDIL